MAFCFSWLLEFFHISITLLPYPAKQFNQYNEGHIKLGIFWLPRRFFKYKQIFFCLFIRINLEMVFNWVVASIIYMFYLTDTKIYIMGLSCGPVKRQRAGTSCAAFNCRPMLSFVDWIWYDFCNNVYYYRVNIFLVLKNARAVTSCCDTQDVTHDDTQDVTHGDTQDVTHGDN